MKDIERQAQIAKIMYRNCELEDKLSKANKRIAKLSARIATMRSIKARDCNGRWDCPKYRRQYNRQFNRKQYQHDYYKAHRGKK